MGRIKKNPESFFTRNSNSERNPGRTFVVIPARNPIDFPKGRMSGGFVVETPGGILA